MKRMVAVLLGSLMLSGCVVMTHKEYQKQQEMWQSVGRLTGLVECQSYLLSKVEKAEKKEVKDEPAK